MKKTFKVENLINEVNRLNVESTCDPKLRIGWNSLLETVLFETDNYKGYVLIEFKKIIDKVGYNQETKKIVDDTRRRYLK